MGHDIAILDGIQALVSRISWFGHDVCLVSLVAFVGLLEYFLPG
jgi:hypothetical protein